MDENEFIVESLYDRLTRSLEAYENLNGHTATAQFNEITETGDRRVLSSIRERIAVSVSFDPPELKFICEVLEDTLVFLAEEINDAEPDDDVKKLQEDLARAVICSELLNKTTEAFIESVAAIGVSIAEASASNGEGEQ